jgi:hypothetical protein
MATTSTRKSGPAPGAAANGSSGFTVSPGPYEAIVQGHVKGSRMGQLIVTIPDWGAGVTPYDTTSEGDGDSSKSDQLTVSYASPFYGVTYNSLTGDAPNTPQTAGQSYGMWFVPPDIGNTVLVTFVGGDTSRGYWFGCVYNSPSHHMVPGIARNIGPNTATPPDSDGLSGKINKSNINNMPVVEYDIGDPNAFTDGFNTTPRYPHEYQSAILINQGLDQDKIRGAVSSSSMRESPSNVYGISTPGRALGNKSQDPTQSQAVYFRKGGHSFVMDDGADGTGQDTEGTDQLIRLRTAGGHQILMNDTENVLYIAGASGAQWMEFSADGSINVFGAAGINMRSEGPINMHSDASITLDSPHIAINALPSTKLPPSALGALGIIPTINIKSMGKMSVGAALAADFSSAAALSIAAPVAVNVSSAGVVNLGGQASTVLTSAAVVISGATSTQISGGVVGLNCVPAIPVPKIPTTFIPPIPHTLQDTVLNGSNWQSVSSSLLTTVSVAPAHEPWVDSDGKSRPKAAGGLAGLAAGVLLGGVTSSLTQTAASTINSATTAVTSSLPSIGPKS